MRNRNWSQTTHKLSSSIIAKFCNVKNELMLIDNNIESRNILYLATQESSHPGYSFGSSNVLYYPHAVWFWTPELVAHPEVSAWF